MLRQKCEIATRELCYAGQDTKLVLPWARIAISLVTSLVKTGSKSL